jgi:hypothetical protein
MIFEEADNIPCSAEAEVDPVAVTMELNIERMRNHLNEHRIEMLKAQIKASDAIIKKLHDDLADDQVEAARAPAGWVVVDNTWKRGPLHLNKKGWLGSASESFPPTVFASECAAHRAIADTKAFEGGIYGWSYNNYLVLQQLRSSRSSVGTKKN